PFPTRRSSDLLLRRRTVTSITRFGSAAPRAFASPSGLRSLPGKTIFVLLDFMLTYPLLIRQGSETRRQFVSMVARNVETITGQAGLRKMIGQSFFLAFAARSP